MASPTNRQKNSGIMTSLAFSMPLPMPKTRMATAASIATVSQKPFPPATASNCTPKLSTPCVAASEPVSASNVYLKIQPTTTE